MWWSRYLFTPQDECVLDRVAVIGMPDAGNRKPEALVQRARRTVRASHLQRGAAGAEMSRFVEYALQQRRADPVPPMFRQHREVVDVQLVEDTPERTEADGVPRVAAGDEDI